MPAFKRFFVTLIVFATTNAGAAVDIKHHEFVLTLGGDWVQVASSDPDRFNFESKILKSSIVISVERGLNVPQARLVEVANKFLEFRLDAERRARTGAQLEFGDKWAKLQPSGDVAELGYAGFDPQGTIFRFLGYVTQQKVVSFWLATESRDSEASGKIFDEAFRGLKFYVP
jgi:hypothetical protein